MSSQILVTPIELRATATEFQTAATEANQIVADVSGALRNVQVDWEGVAQAAFFSALPVWERGLGSIAQIYQDIAMQLGWIADNFEQTDGSVANLIDPLTNIP